MDRCMHCIIPNESYNINHTLLTETTATQNEVALTYHSVRGLHFLAVVFAATII